MDKETLEKANKIAKQIKDTEKILKGVEDGGRLQIIAWVKNRSVLGYSETQVGSLLFDPKEDFIGIGLMNLVKGYLDYLNKQLKEL